MGAFWGVLLGGLTVLAGSGLALGAALGLTGLLILEFVAGGSTFVAVDAVWNVLNSFTLSAIPLFVLLGEILLRSGVSEKIYTALSPLFQRAGGVIPSNRCRRCNPDRGEHGLRCPTEQTCRGLVVAGLVPLTGGFEQLDGLTPFADRLAVATGPDLPRSGRLSVKLH